MNPEIAALGLVLAAIALVFVSTVATGASPLPTSAAVRDAMLAALPARIDGPIYELGSGWGGLAAALARRYPAAPVTGFEVSALPWAVSKLRSVFGGPPNLTIRLRDFHGASLADAALVVCFLTPPAMEKLKSKLESELGPGALVLSNTFAFRDWQPAEVRTVPDPHRSRVYLYRIDG
jgi:hypothetical protein